MHSPQNKITTSKVKWDVKLFPETILTSGVVKSTITGGKTIAYTDDIIITSASIQSQK